MRSLFMGLAGASLLVGAVAARPAAAQIGSAPFGQAEPAVTLGYFAPSPYASFPYAQYPVTYPTWPSAISVGWWYPLPAWPAAPSASAQANAGLPAGVLPGLGSTPCTLSSRWVPC